MRGRSKKFIFIFLNTQTTISPSSPSTSKQADKQEASKAVVKSTAFQQR
jgi:hypothetical protein